MNSIYPEPPFDVEFISRQGQDLQKGHLLEKLPMSSWHQQLSKDPSSTFVVYLEISSIAPSVSNARWTHEANTVFSAAIKSCRGLSSSFPISAGTGIVELWAIFTVALLNIVVGGEVPRAGAIRLRHRSPLKLQAVPKWIT
jgi:hypothetical protein